MTVRRPVSGRDARAWAFLAAGATLILATGCRFSEHRENLESSFAAGRFDLAAQDLDNPKTIDLYGSKNRTLYELDRGAVAFALSDYETAIRNLNSAEDRIESARERSVGDKIGQWAVNDTTATYIAEPYEDMYLNVIKLMAQLGAGRLSGGATVEARRIGSKADRLRDQYLKYKDQVEQESTSKLAGRAGSYGGLVATNDDGNFIESPLGTYLAAVTFMKTGNPELQRVAGKRLNESIRLQSAIIGPVNPDDFVDIEERRDDSVNVLLIALSGRGPTKYADRVGPIPVGTFPVYFELPRLRTHPSQAARARVEIEGLGGEPASTHELKFIEDLSAVATENHKRMLPLIYTRTLIRAAVKAGLSATATEIARRNANDRNTGLVQVAGAVAGLAFMMATERADLRCWVFLPGQARVGLLRLPPGEHRARIVYESAGGGTVYASEWKTLSVRDGDLATLVTQYWN
jgi:hypothetical protein